ncbi:phage tail protein [Comamonas sp. Y33R10-2]|uniref:phage tail protein n=1 Tax=Comamonas sp. Y33R10-2 TaxID=2853257 RepID=UPI001C5CBDBE|nr:phage tail protein [Comamonas sp. Y33R10-2]QXZ10276.1 phage tail protein [Comamonas sp. Y33R10-2]
MLKPINLREHLTAGLPELQRDPERLIMLIRGGRVRATATKSLSWQYEYTLRLIFCDWTLHADVIVALLLPWLHHNQNEMLANPDKNKTGIRFDVDYLNVNAMDFVLDLELTERVLCRPIEGTPGQVNLTHVDDQPPDHLHQAENWKVMFEGQQIAEWSYPAPPPLHHG